jgi:hypothetical protein
MSLRSVLDQPRRAGPRGLTRVYESLGFAEAGGDQSQGWLILREAVLFEQHR